MTQAQEPGLPMDSFKVLAKLSGMEFTDQHLEEIAPQLQLAMDTLSRLNELDLGDIEPASIFQLKKE